MTAPSTSLAATDRGGDRDLHLLLPAEPQRVLVIGDPGVAVALERAGHSTRTAEDDDEDWGTGFDVGILISPHRQSGDLEDLLARLDASLTAAASLIVVDRPRWAWPDVLGRRDVETSRRWRHHAYSARRIRAAVSACRPVHTEVLIAPHDRRYRHMVPVRLRGPARIREAVGLMHRELWSEGRLPARFLATVLGRLGPRALIGTAPTAAWIGGPAALPMVIEEFAEARNPVAFLGSDSSSTVTVVCPDGEAGSVLVHDPDQTWSASGLVAVSDSLETAAPTNVIVAAHRLAGSRVEVDWLGGRPATPADLVKVATALGAIHRSTACGNVSVGTTTVAQGRQSLTLLVERARTVAPRELRELLDGLEFENTPVSWIHGDWGLRNVRIVGDRIGVFDLEFADRQGSAAFDVGWFLLREPEAGPECLAAYEEAAGRTISSVDLRLGLVAILTRYGPTAALAAWSRVMDSGLDIRR